MIALLWMLLGVAEAHDVRLCGQWTPAFDEGNIGDDDPYDHNGDGIVDNDTPDFLQANTPQPLRGMWLVAEAQLATGAWVVQWQGYAPASGPNAGCTDVFTPVAYNAAGHALVRLVPATFVSVGGHDLEIRDNTSNAMPWSEPAYTPSLVTASGRYDQDLGTSELRVDVSIALAWALAREDGGVSPMDLVVYTCGQNCSQGANGWYLHDTKELFVGTESRLTLMFHELGHAIRYHAGSGTEVPVNYGDWEQWDPAVSECHGGPIGSKHWQTSDEATPGAINEGWADYYAAVVLNKTNEADAFLFGDFDWDHNDVLDGSNYFSIEREPRPLMPFGSMRDYWSYYCPQTEINLSTEYDWSRGFWDLDTDRGLTFEIILQVFVHAVDLPATAWDRKVGTCNTGTCAWELMRDNAYLLNDSYYGLGPDEIGDAWASECGNGICR